MAKPAKRVTLAKKLQTGEVSRKLASAWSPLRESVFRALWIATVVSNIGTWMQDVGESWLMTSLTSSPVLVALRVTAEDREVERRAQAFHLGPESPRITHLIAEQLPK